MKTQMKQFTKIAAATALLAASLISTGAMAESVTSSIDAKAGLQPALEMTCTPLSFGVWRVPVRTGTGVTTITLDAGANSVTAGGELNRVAKSSNGAWIHNKGVCTVSGSRAADNTLASITVNSSSGTNMAFIGDAASFTSLAAANTPADLRATLDVPTSSTFQTGATTFNIGGVLTIPGTIIAANYGGYKTSTAASITAADVMP